MYPYGPYLLKSLAPENYVLSTMTRVTLLFYKAKESYSPFHQQSFFKTSHSQPNLACESIELHTTRNLSKNIYVGKEKTLFFKDWSCDEV